MQQQKKLQNKGQEEIVGFVAVVVIVAVIFVIFLGIIVRQNIGEKFVEGRDVQQFLESIMQYTSDCALGYEPNYAKLEEIIRECYKSDRKCISGEKACEIVNKTLSEIIENSLTINNVSSVSGYEFEALYSTNISQESFLYIRKGNCEKSVIGGEIISPAFPGTIRHVLKLCYR